MSESLVGEYTHFNRLLQIQNKVVVNSSTMRIGNPFHSIHKSWNDLFTNFKYSGAVGTFPFSSQSSHASPLVYVKSKSIKI